MIVIPQSFHSLRCYLFALLITIFLMLGNSEDTWPLCPYGAGAHFTNDFSIVIKFDGKSFMLQFIS